MTCKNRNEYETGLTCVCITTVSIGSRCMVCMKGLTKVCPVWTVMGLKALNSMIRMTQEASSCSESRIQKAKNTKKRTTFQQ